MSTPSDPRGPEGFELLEHPGGFRAILPVRRGMMSVVKAVKIGPLSGTNALSVVLAMVVFLPIVSLSRRVPGTSQIVLFLVAFLLLTLVLHLLGSGIDPNPARIVDVDLGKVQVSDRSGKVLFQAPLEVVGVRIGGGLQLEAGEEAITVKTMVDLRPLLARFERARVAHGTAGDVPSQMEQLRDQ